eukprot:12889494-Alexandrium_andersonii.AAC.1
MGARTGHIVVAGDFNCGIEAQSPILDALRSADMHCLGGLPHAAGSAVIDQVWASRLLLGPGELRVLPPTRGDHGYLAA